MLVLSCVAAKDSDRDCITPEEVKFEVNDEIHFLNCNNEKDISKQSVQVVHICWRRRAHYIVCVFEAVSEKEQLVCTELEV